MKVKVLYFAQFREAAGKSEETLELCSENHAGELLRQVMAKFPSLSGLEQRISIAVNREVVKEDTCLRDGDEVAFLSPLAGG